MGKKINYTKIHDDKYVMEIEINYYSESRHGSSEYYEYDKDNNRYYILADSSNLSKNMDGALVKRRISQKCFNEVLEIAKKYLR